MVNRKCFVLWTGAVLIAAACALPDAARAQEQISYDGSSQIYWALIKDSADAFTTATGIPVEAKDGKTKDAVPAVVAGRANVGGLARKMKLAEKAQAPNLCETLIARDYMAVFVASDCRVDQISLDNLRRVFSGQIADWKDLGGAPGPIQVVIPQTNTACNQNFVERVMGEATFAASSTITPTAGAVIDAARGKPAISFISFGAVGQDRAFKVLKVDGALPGEAGYPIVQEMYLVTLGAPAGATKKYIDFFLQGQGREIIAQAGLVPAEKLAER